MCLPFANRTRGCARLANFVVMDKLRKGGSAAQNTIKIVVPEENGACKFKGLRRKKDGLSNGMRPRDVTGPKWFGN